MSTLVYELFEACIIAAEFDGGVIIGGDSRSIKGELYSNDSFKNFAQVRKQIYIFGYGLNSEIQNTLFQVTVEVRRTEKLNDPEKATVSFVANLVRFFIDRLGQKIQSFGGTAFIVAGWDKMRGAQVYYISEWSSLNYCGKVAVLGPWAGILNHYECRAANFENMTEDECVKFVEQRVRFMTERFDYSGRSIKMIKCDDKGSYGRIIPITPDGGTDCSGSNVPFRLIDFELEKETVNFRKEDPVEEEV